MNKRLDDQIAQVAFGDADPELEARIEQLAVSDAEVRATLDSYRAMRKGLRAMSPAIQHQLSTDRLREEILRRGLENRTRGFDFRWLFVPAAALGAYAFVTLALRSAPTQPVLVSSNSEVAKPAPNVDLPAWTPPMEVPEGMALESTPHANAGSSTLAANRKPAEAARARPAGKPSRDDSPIVRNESAASKVAMKDEAPRVLAVRNSDAPGAARGGAAGDPSPAFGSGLALSATAAPNGPAAADAAAPAESGIVVIQPVRDRATGAYRATEVASPSNVLIGS